MKVQEAYSILEEVVTRGYLIARVKIAGVYIVLKNINRNEYKNLECFVGSSNTKIFEGYRLALCTLSIGDKFFLDKKYDDLYDIVEFYEGIPGCAIKKLQECLNKLDTYFFEALDYLEGFCYTKKSRVLWGLWDDSYARSSSSLFIMDHYGLNIVQENWVLVNKQLDSEEEYDRQFNMAILIASSFNGKGARSMSRSYDLRRRELQELRDEIALYGYDKKRAEENKKPDKWADPNRLKTKEDVVKELYKQMRGEKDIHDLYIDKWKEQQREKVKEMSKRVEERQQEYRDKIKELDLSLIEDSRPVSVEEVEKIKNKKRGKPSERVKEYNKMEAQRSYLKRYGSRIIRPTNN